MKTDDEFNWNWCADECYEGGKDLHDTHDWQRQLADDGRDVPYVPDPRDNWSPLTGCPSPEERHQIAAEIRKTWDKRTELERRGVDPDQRVEIPGRHRPQRRHGGGHEPASGEVG